jgi:hypothetical protein
MDQDADTVKVEEASSALFLLSELASMHCRYRRLLNLSVSLQWLLESVLMLNLMSMWKLKLQLSSL